MVCHTEQVLSEELLERYKNELRNSEKSERTICKYCHDILLFLHFLRGSKTAEKKDVIAYKNWLAGRYAASSVNSMLVALNGFLKYAGLNHCCVKLLRVQRSVFCDRRRELNREEYMRLLLAARHTGQEKLYLLIQTICATGIRVSELQYVTVEAIRRGMAIVDNKGKRRSILIPLKLQKCLTVYISSKKIETGSVFVTQSGKPIDRKNIWKSMKRLCEIADVDPNKVFPHNLRHLFAKEFYEKGKDITRLADILGHQNIDTTRRYIISSGEEHERLLNALDLMTG